MSRAQTRTEQPGGSGAAGADAASAAGNRRWSNTSTALWGAEGGDGDGDGGSGGFSLYLTAQRQHQHRLWRRGKTQALPLSRVPMPWKFTEGWDAGWQFAQQNVSIRFQIRGERKALWYCREIKPPRKKASVFWAEHWWELWRRKLPFGVLHLKVVCWGIRPKFLGC